MAYTSDAGPPRAVSNRHAGRYALGALAGVELAALAVLLAVQPRGQLTQTVGDLAQLTASLLATAGCLRAARRGGPARRGWAVMASALGVWAAAVALWTWYGVTRDHLYPFPSLADLGFVGYAIPAIAALLLFPRSSMHRASRLRELLDAAVIAGAVLFTSWSTVLGPLYLSSGTGLTRAVGLSYPIMDMTVASVVLVLGMQVAPEQRRPWLLLGSGLLMITLTDSAFVSMTEQGQIGQTGSPLVLGWVAAMTLITVASQIRPRSPRQAPLRNLSVLQELLPAIPLAGAIAVAIARSPDHRDTFLVGNAVFLLVLCGAQQLVAAFERVRVANGLEETIARRTAEIEFRTLHDSLTGLPNRELLADQCEQALAADHTSGTRTGLLVLDLDRFKEVNDAFGYESGDQLLRQIGPRLAGVLAGEHTVGRLGGDEFAVLIPDVRTADEATTIAFSLVAALQLPFHIEGADVDVEASIGVVVSGQHGLNATTLLQHAEIALDVAKTLTSGVFTYDPAVDSHTPSRLALFGDLRRALERGELVLHYQPKISLSTGNVVGAEALVRWQHPARSLIFPDEFIPMAEHTTLIGPLTRHLLDTALTQARTWIDAGRPLPIAVNLSNRNLHDEDFVGEVSELLAAHDVPAQLLELELTESALTIDPVRARQMLEQLSALGVRISIDDFGAGYTSLGQLTTLPVSELKIDRSFVMTMTQDQGNAVIVQSVIDLGHDLGLTLVAEGVETEESLTILAGLGCDVAQGYHICRPVPALDFDLWCAGRTLTVPQIPGSARQEPASVSTDATAGDRRSAPRVPIAGARGAG